MSGSLWEWGIKKQKQLTLKKKHDTLWQSNMVVGNPPFIDELPFRHPFQGDVNQYRKGKLPNGVNCTETYLPDDWYHFLVKGTATVFRLPFTRSFAKNMSRAFSNVCGWIQMTRRTIKRYPGCSGHLSATYCRWLWIQGVIHIPAAPWTCRCNVHRQRNSPVVSRVALHRVDARIRALLRIVESMSRSSASLQLLAQFEGALFEWFKAQRAQWLNCAAQVFFLIPSGKLT
jgi:hypothetical protein